MNDRNDRHDIDDDDELQPNADARPHGIRSVVVSVALFAVTFLSTTYVGSLTAPGSGNSLWSGLSYSLPLMTILLCHELGHYIAARIHGVPTSPPYFVPMPVPPLGTMGAVIVMRGRIARRNALLDIGAAGPLAGMAIEALDADRIGAGSLSLMVMVVEAIAPTDAPPAGFPSVTTTVWRFEIAKTGVERTAPGMAGESNDAKTLVRLPAMSYA